MSKRQENDIRMARAVAEVLKRHEGVWSESKAFSVEVAECRDLMEQLGESRMQGLKKTTGATEDKAALGKQLLQWQQTWQAGQGYMRASKSLCNCTNN